MLVPVGPASARISPQTKAAIRTGPKPAGRLARVRMQTATNTSSVVGIISLIRLVTLLGMDGWLQKQLSFRIGLGVRAQCGSKCSQTRTEPTNAPNIWAVTYGTSLEKFPLATATPKLRPDLCGRHFFRKLRQ